MKTLYFECGMGAAGDMLMAALLELIPDRELFLNIMNSLGLPGVKVSAETAVRCGISGTRVTVSVNGEEEDCAHSDHHHGSKHTAMSDVEQLVGGLSLPDSVLKDVLAVYKLIAEAESHVHGVPVSQIHFHEVGNMDAVTDIVGVCLLLHLIAPDRVLASPVHVGAGFVHCAHGMLPVPAPATAHILRGIPVYGGKIQGELCTPTGAALLKHFATNFEEMPTIKISRIGYGMGKKDFDAANCVRAVLGESSDGNDRIVELCCNLDDMTPEAIGFAQEKLFSAGALDVYTISIGMKKNRPGVLLSCICEIEQREDMARLIFKHTRTLGIREREYRRYTLERDEHTEQTPYGSVRIKSAKGWGVVRQKAEFEDLAEIARNSGLSLDEVAALLP